MCHWPDSVLKLLSSSGSPKHFIQLGELLSCRMWHKKVFIGYYPCYLKAVTLVKSVGQVLNPFCGMEPLGSLKPIDGPFFGILFLDM